MRPRIRWVGARRLLLAWALVTRAARGADSEAASGFETLSIPGREPLAGRLVAKPDGAPAFQPRDNGGNGAAMVVELEPGMTISRPAQPKDVGVGPPPFMVDLGIGQRISGKLTRVDEREIVLADTVTRGPVTIARGGATSISQRPGETLVLQEGFESLETSRWTINGEPALAGEPRRGGATSLRLPADGASLAFRVPEPFESGRLHVAFFDGGETSSNHKWSLDLTFRTLNGPETVRVILGWIDASLAVESPGGPALAVQRLARSPGWRALGVRFTPERLEIAVGGDELAHGKGVNGPLVEVRLATSRASRGDAPRNLAAILDDLALIRLSEPPTDLEIDASQDEIRLASGDQLYGDVPSCDTEALTAVLNGRTIRVPWSEATGVYFRRTATPGVAVSGLLARVEWRSGPGTEGRDLDRVEGALTGLSATDLTLATPYAGTLVIPRDRVTEVEILGRGTRLVVDPKAHHLGDEVSVMAPILDPPQPEGGVLERAFELPRLGAGEVQLVLDVVQVAGEGVDLPFAMLVKKGELRTNVAINGNPFDYINRLVPDRNEAPRRVRLAIPRDQLRPGKNVIRFEQVGIANDPNYLDDLGILGVAIEALP